MVACMLLILFNGVTAFLEEPFGVRRFVSSYISVSARLAFPGYLAPSLTMQKLPVFLLLILGHKIRNHGFRFSEWAMERSEDLGQTVQVRGEKRKGRLEFPDNTLTKENLRTFAEWVWVWLK